MGNYCAVTCPKVSMSLQLLRRCSVLFCDVLCLVLLHCVGYAIVGSAILHVLFGASSCMLVSVLCHDVPCEAVLWYDPWCCGVKGYLTKVLNRSLRVSSVSSVLVIYICIVCMHIYVYT